MAKMISSDSIYNGFVEQKHWFINDRFDLVVESGKNRTDFYILDKDDKHYFIKLIQKISKDLKLYDDKEVNLLPTKDKCGISVLKTRADEMFKLLENYLLNYQEEC